MRELCYIVGIIICLAVGIGAWFIADFSIFTIIFTVLAAIMLTLCIIGWVKGWRCMFTAARAS